MKMKALLLKRVDAYIGTLKSARTALAPTGLGAILKRVSAADKAIVRAQAAYDRIAGALSTDLAPVANGGRSSILSPREFGEELRAVFKDRVDKLNTEIEMWEEIRSAASAAKPSVFENEG